MRRFFVSRPIVWILTLFLWGESVEQGRSQSPLNPSDEQNVLSEFDINRTAGQPVPLEETIVEGASAPMKDAPLGIPETILRYSPEKIRIESVLPRTVLLYSSAYGAETSFAIAPPPASNPDGTNPDGTNPDGTNPDGTNPGGTNPDGTNLDSTNPDGSPANSAASVYGFGALCWNIPCSQQTMLRKIPSRALLSCRAAIPLPTESSPPLQNADTAQSASSFLLIPKVGYGFQRESGELLASLAMAGIAPDYEIRIQNELFHVSDLIESQKSLCFEQQNLAFAAIGLSYYLEKINDEWAGTRGEIWSLEAILRHEQNRSVDWTTEESTDKLLGLTFLLHRFQSEIQKDPTSAATWSPERQQLIQQTNETLLSLRQRILSYRDEQGLWKTWYFEQEPPVTHPYQILRTSGSILRWLVEFSSSDELRTPEMRQSFEKLAALLCELFPPNPQQLSQLSIWETEILCQTLQTLTFYQKKIQ